MAGEVNKLQEAAKHLSSLPYDPDRWTLNDKHIAANFIDAYLDEQNKLTSMWEECNRLTQRIGGLHKTLAELESNLNELSPEDGESL